MDSLGRPSLTLPASLLRLLVYVRNPRSATCTDEDMIWNGLRGREAQIEMFRRSARRGRLASAYLLVGPDGTGKRLFARKLAQALFCERTPDEQLDACGECPSCRQMQAGTHPDFLSVACPEGKRELTIGLIAGEKDERGRAGLCHDLSMRPMASSRRIALVDGADLMNDESANAFLKTLEEPPPYAMLILLAGSADGLLPTIRSRCQQVRFPPLLAEDIEALLLSTGMTADPAEAAATAALSDGSLATAAQLLDPKLRALRDRLYAGLADPRYGSVQLARDVIAAVEEVGGDTPGQRQCAVWVIRFAVEFYRQTLRRLSEHGEELSGAISPQAAGWADRLDRNAPRVLEKIMELSDRSAVAESQIERMAPTPLCLEALFDDLGRVLRAV